MEDMRYSTKQLTDQMHLDTALQMRHILENGKSIVPRVSSHPFLVGLLQNAEASEHAPLLNFYVEIRQCSRSTERRGLAMAITGLGAVASEPCSLPSPNAQAFGL